MGKPVDGSYSQDGFRFRNDDGSQTAATWIDALNTNVDLEQDAVFRLRVRVQQTSSAMTTNAGNTEKNFKLRVSQNGGAYADIGAVGSASALRYASSGNVSDGNATTSQLSGSGTFIAGTIDNNNDTGTLVFGAGGLQYTELEFVLQINSAVANDGDTFAFRVYETSNVALNSYTQTGVATAAAQELALSLNATEEGLDRMLVMLTDPPVIRLTGITPDGANAVKVSWSHDNRPPDYVPGNRDERWE